MKSGSQNHTAALELCSKGNGGGKRSTTRSPGRFAARPTSTRDLYAIHKPAQVRTGREGGRERQTDRHRQTDRQIDRQTDRETDRDRETIRGKDDK